jgi:hypothetical protein
MASLKRGLSGAQHPRLSTRAANSAGRRPRWSLMTGTALADCITPGFVRAPWPEFAGRAGRSGAAARGDTQPNADDEVGE